MPRQRGFDIPEEVVPRIIKLDKLCRQVSEKVATATGMKTGELYAPTIKLLTSPAIQFVSGSNIVALMTRAAKIAECPLLEEFEDVNFIYALIESEKRSDKLVKYLLKTIRLLGLPEYEEQLLRAYLLQTKSATDLAFLFDLSPTQVAKDMCTLERRLFRTIIYKYKEV